MSKETMKDIPLAIKGEIAMNEVDEDITLYNGYFDIILDQLKIKCSGKLYYEWSSSNQIRIVGDVISDISEDFLIKIWTNPYTTLVNNELEINGSVIGKILFTKLNFSNLSKTGSIAGILDGKVLLGEASIPINKISFCIPNLRYIEGTLIKVLTSNNRESFFNGRLKLESRKYLILIDQRDVNGIKNIVKEGRFLITHFGEIHSKVRNFDYNDFQNVIDILNKFLSFINGRRTSAFYFKAYANEDWKWSELTAYNTDPYKDVLCWSHGVLPESINEIWIEFNNLCKNEEDFSILNTVIHWYIEANGNSGLVEGSIIMAQTALELLFNWWLIEKKGVLKDTNRKIEHLSAAKKLRLLLLYLNVPYSLPEELTNLNMYAKSFQQNNDTDAPYIITLIRNNVVHQKANNRSAVKNPDNLAKYESLQLSLWYIELCLLKILNYNGEYSNRFKIYNKIYKKLEAVPWSKSN